MFVGIAFFLLDRYERAKSDNIVSNTTLFSSNATDAQHAHTHSSPSPHTGVKRVARSSQSASRRYWKPEYEQYKQANNLRSTNFTLLVNTSTSFLLQPCDYFQCGHDKSLWGGVEIYTCYMRLMDMVRDPNGEALCPSWDLAIWHTGGTDWGHQIPSDHTNLTNRLTVQKINTSSPAVVLTLNNVDPRDEGYFIV